MGFASSDYLNGLVLNLQQWSLVTIFYGINNAAHWSALLWSFDSLTEGTQVRVKVHDYDTSISDNTMFIESASVLPTWGCRYCQNL